MKFIRWKAVVPTLVFLLLLTLFIVFFLDSVVKWAIVKAGQGVFGARVNIESVTVKLRQSSLRIQGMQVADKADPMKNLFQFDNAVFDAEALPLLEKKAVIDQASITGLKFGTQRKTSGALTFEETRPGFVGKAVDRVWSQVETISLDKFEGAKKYYDPKTVVNPDALQTFKAADNAKSQLQKTPDEIKKQIDNLNAQKRVEELQKRIQALGQSGNALQKVQDAQSIQKDLSKLRSDVETTRTSVTDRIQSAQKLVDDVKQAKEEDWKKLKSTLSIPTLDRASIARAIFGPSVAHNLERLLGWVHEGRRYMPAKAQAPPPPPRGHGRTIEFPRDKVWPRFLLKKAELAGELGLENPLAFQGTLQGVTSNPKLYGHPALLHMQGGQGGRSFLARGVFDHTHDVPMESLQGQYNGFALSNLTLGQSKSLGVVLNKGMGSITAAATITGEALQGQVGFKGDSLSLTPNIETKSSSDIAQRLTNSLTASLAQTKSLSASVGVGGTLTAPTFDVSSNIGDVVSNALKSAVGAEAQKQEQALRAELDRQTQAKLNELTAQVDALRKNSLPQLAAVDQVIDGLLGQVKKQATGGVGLPGKGVDSLKGIFGR